MSGSTASDFKAVNVVIKGSVQGVFYRKWTVDAAEKLGLKGWVRNLEDGSVEAVFSGPPSAVDNMIQQCHSGPSGAKVSSVDVLKWDNEVPQGFEKRSWFFAVATNLQSNKDTQIDLSRCFTSRLRTVDISCKVCMKFVDIMPCGR